MPALARAAAAASHVPGAARYVFVGSRLEQRGDVAGVLDRWRRGRRVEVGARTERSREEGEAAGGEGKDAGSMAGGGGGGGGGGDDGSVAEDGDAEGKFDTFATYGTAKQAGTALTYELARRVEAAAAAEANGSGSGIVIHACTPGMVNTNLGRFVGPVLQTLAAPLQWALMKTSKQGAEVPLWLATSESGEVVGRGSRVGYFGTEGSFKPGPVVALQSSDASRDPQVGRELWAACEEMHGEVDSPLL